MMAEFHKNTIYLYIANTTKLVVRGTPAYLQVIFQWGPKAKLTVSIHLVDHVLKFGFCGILT